MLLHYQVQFKHIIWQTCFQWMSFQTFKHEYGQWNSLMCILCRMPPFWLTQLVHHCKWLVHVAILLAPKPHLLLFSALIGLDIFFMQKQKHRQQQQQHWNLLWCFSDEGHGFLHSRKNNLRCLNNAFALSGPIQAHNLTNMFLMNVLSNFQTWIRAMKFTYVYS